MTLGCRPLCQLQEVHVPYRYCGISWFHPISRGTMHGSGEGLDDPIMAGILQYL